MDFPLEVLILIFSFVDAKCDLESLFCTDKVLKGLKTNELFKKLWITWAWFSKGS